MIVATAMERLAWLSIFLFVIVAVVVLWENRGRDRPDYSQLIPFGLLAIVMWVFR